MQRKLCAAAAAAILLALPDLAAAALSSAGNGLVNDPDFNLTWPADGSLFRTMSNADPQLVSKIMALGTTAAVDFCATTDGHLTWAGANGFVQYLNAIRYAGFNDWRLPATPPSAQVFNSFNQTSNDLGHLFYTELGGVAGQAISNVHNASHALFINIESFTYHTANLDTSTVPPSQDWAFNMGNGATIPVNRVGCDAVWPVRTGLSAGASASSSGDAPLPTWAYVLLALALLFPILRHKRQADMLRA